MQSSGRLDFERYVCALQRGLDKDEPSGEAGLTDVIYCSIAHPSDSLIRFD